MKKNLMRYFMSLIASSIFLFISGCNNTQTIDFKSFTSVNESNGYLACPEDFCSIQPNQLVPAYPVNINILRAAWIKTLQAQPRTELVASDGHGFHYQYVQYSEFFHFPDYIDIEFIPLTNTTSTLAVYSRGKYGYFDFKVNKNRVQTWLDLIPSYLKDNH